MADSVSQAVIALTIALGGALLIERLIEAMKHIIEQAGQQQDLPFNQRLDKIKRSVAIATNALLVFEKADSKEQSAKAYADAIEVGLDAVAKDFPATRNFEEESDGEEITDDGFENYSAITVKKLAPVNPKAYAKRKLRLFYHVAALGLGIIYASAMDIHLITLLLNGDIASGLKPIPEGAWAEFIDEVLSGLVIAGGSQPIHVLIRFISTRKLPASAVPPPEDDSEEAKVLAAVPAPIAVVAAPVVTAPALAAAAPVPAPVVTSWQPINYQGGVKPASLEHRNKRKGNPNKIIFHHTAMSSDLGFQAIVDEFLVNKGWSTGYHCVIMPDGAIRPFCRWDRVGNHTKGMNNQTLGVAFHGNFHTDTNDNYSNHDGRFGINAPTTPQLEAGARLIALWVNLYDDISLDDIFGHREAKPGYTVCPGSNFPMDELRARVKALHEEWQSSDDVQQQLVQYRTRPYLYI